MKEAIFEVNLRAANGDTICAEKVGATWLEIVQCFAVFEDLKLHSFCPAGRGTNRLERLYWGNYSGWGRQCKSKVGGQESVGGLVGAAVGGEMLHLAFV